jgi:ribosomal protein L35AE/L33A
MTETFNVGDKVIYEDSSTGETKYGIITSMSGTDGIIRTTTETEIGSIPKAPAKAL